MTGREAISAVGLGTAIVAGAVLLFSDMAGTALWLTVAACTIGLLVTD